MRGISVVHLGAPKRMNAHFLAGEDERFFRAALTRGALRRQKSRSTGDNERPEQRQFAALSATMVRAPLGQVGVVRSGVWNHERAQPARGFPVRRSLAARVCLRSCPAGALTRAKPGTGPPSLVSGGHGRRPFRYPRARLTRLGVPESPLQSTRLAMRRSLCARRRHTKMAATRMGLAGLALSRSWTRRGRTIESPGFRRTLRVFTTGERRGPRAP